MIKKVFLYTSSYSFKNIFFLEKFYQWKKFFIGNQQTNWVAHIMCDACLTFTIKKNVAMQWVGLVLINLCKKIISIKSHKCSQE